MTESILRLDRVEKADGSPVDLTKQSALKAYANLNGEMASVRDSFNLSSVADNGVGHYTFNLASAMSGAGYAPTMSLSNWVGANAVRVVEINSDANITATSIPLLQLT